MNTELYYFYVVYQSKGDNSLKKEEIMAECSITEHWLLVKTIKMFRELDFCGCLF